jgi:hypothetical protein
LFVVESAVPEEAEEGEVEAKLRGSVVVVDVPTLVGTVEAVGPAGTH